MPRTSLDRRDSLQEKQNYEAHHNLHECITATVTTLDHLFPCVKTFCGMKHNTMGTFAIQRDVNKWPSTLTFSHYLEHDPNRNKTKFRSSFYQLQHDEIHVQINLVVLAIKKYVIHVPWS